MNDPEPIDFIPLTADNIVSAINDMYVGMENLRVQQKAARMSKLVGLLAGVLDFPFKSPVECVSDERLGTIGKPEPKYLFILHLDRIVYHDPEGFDTERATKHIKVIFHQKPPKSRELEEVLKWAEAEIEAYERRPQLGGVGIFNDTVRPFRPTIDPKTYYLL